jgi:disulfide bond formation protein DsbB
MKKTLIGCCLSLVGALGYLAVMVFTGGNLVSGWSTPPGRFLTTVAKLGMSFPLFLSVALLAVGLVILAAEFFRTEK